MRQLYWGERTDLARGVRQGRRPLVTPPSRPPSSPRDVERRQFVSTAKTLRLRSALMALSGAASSVTTAPMSVPILKHRGHILRPRCPARTASSVTLDSATPPSPTSRARKTRARSPTPTAAATSHDTSYTRLTPPVAPLRTPAEVRVPPARCRAECSFETRHCGRRAEVVAARAARGPGEALTTDSRPPPRRGRRHDAGSARGAACELREHSSGLSNALDAPCPPSGQAAPPRDGLSKRPAANRSVGDALGYAEERRRWSTRGVGTAKSGKGW